MDEFVAQYRALRIREGWARADGLEDPDIGDSKLWAARLQSVARAASVLSELRRDGRKPVIVDVGAGGGWAARVFPWASVVAVDLIAPPTTSTDFVRGDMRYLPLRNRSVDGVLFAASLHYSHPQQVIPEVARVLRPGGLLVAVDSPLYAGEAAQAAARVRSNDYYESAGFPELASRYHPINGRELRDALQGAGFEVELWKGEPSLLDRLARRFGRPHTSMVVARLT